jgi:hypothetical protein
MRRIFLARKGRDATHEPGRLLLLLHLLQQRQAAGIKDAHVLLGGLHLRSRHKHRGACGQTKELGLGGSLTATVYCWEQRSWCSRRQPVWGVEGWLMGEGALPFLCDATCRLHSTLWPPASALGAATLTCPITCSLCQLHASLQAWQHHPPTPASLAPGSTCKAVLVSQLSGACRCCPGQALQARGPAANGAHVAQVVIPVIWEA